MAPLEQTAFPVLVNGQATHCVDVADRGLQYGDGVFSTLCVEGGVPQFLSRHLMRLQADAARLGLPFPAQSLLRAEILELAAAYPTSVIKIILTRGTGGRGYRCPEPASGTRIISVHPRPAYPLGLLEAGVNVRFCHARLGLNPRLAGIKHLNRLEQVMARAEWGDEQIREGLLMDYEGFVVEGVMSNVFLVSERRLRTPRLDRCGVAGVMRGLVMQCARERGWRVEEVRLHPDEVLAADAIFLTNSIIGIWPVRELDGRLFTVGDAPRQLADGIRRLAAEESASA